MEKCCLYIVLTRTNTVLSRLIQIFKKDEYTHAAISLDKELEHMYSFGRLRTYNPFIGGFKKEDINKGIYQFSKTLPGVIIEVEVSKQQYEKAKFLLDQFIPNSECYKYNYKGLLYNLINRSVSWDDRFLCSEFVYYIIKESGIADLKISRNLVRPQNLLNISNKIIFEGNLKEMKSLNNNWNANDIERRKLSNIYKYVG